MGHSEPLAPASSAARDLLIPYRLYTDVDVFQYINGPALLTLRFVPRDAAATKEDIQKRLQAALTPFEGTVKQVWPAVVPTTAAAPSSSISAAAKADSATAADKKKDDADATTAAAAAAAAAATSSAKKPHAASVAFASQSQMVVFLDAKPQAVLSAAAITDVTSAEITDEGFVVCRATGQALHASALPTHMRTAPFLCHAMPSAFKDIATCRDAAAQLLTRLCIAQAILATDAKGVLYDAHRRPIFFRIARQAKPHPGRGCGSRRVVLYPPLAADRRPLNKAEIVARLRDVAQLSADDARVNVVRTGFAVTSVHTSREPPPSKPAAFLSVRLRNEAAARRFKRAIASPGPLGCLSVRSGTAVFSPELWYEPHSATVIDVPPANVLTGGVSVGASEPPTRTLINLRAYCTYLKEAEGGELFKHSIVQALSFGKIVGVEPPKGELEKAILGIYDGRLVNHAPHTAQALPEHAAVMKKVEDGWAKYKAQQALRAMSNANKAALRASAASPTAPTTAPVSPAPAAAAPKPKAKPAAKATKLPSSQHPLPTENLTRKQRKRAKRAQKTAEAVQKAADKKAARERRRSGFSDRFPTAAPVARAAPVPPQTFPSSAPAPAPASAPAPAPQAANLWTAAAASQQPPSLTPPPSKTNISVSQETGVLLAVLRRQQMQQRLGSVQVEAVTPPWDPTSVAVSVKVDGTAVASSVGPRASHLAVQCEALKSATLCFPGPAPTATDKHHAACAAEALIHAFAAAHPAALQHTSPVPPQATGDAPQPPGINLFTHLPPSLTAAESAAPAPAAATPSPLPPHPPATAAAAAAASQQQQQQPPLPPQARPLQQPPLPPQPRPKQPSSPPAKPPSRRSAAPPAAPTPAPASTPPPRPTAPPPPRPTAAPPQPPSKPLPLGPPLRAPPSPQTAPPQPSSKPPPPPSPSPQKRKAPSEVAAAASPSAPPPPKRAKVKDEGDVVIVSVPPEGWGGKFASMLRSLMSPSRGTIERLTAIAVDAAAHDAAEDVIRLLEERIRDTSLDERALIGAWYLLDSLIKSSPVLRVLAKQNLVELATTTMPSKKNKAYATRCHHLVQTWENIFDAVFFKNLLNAVPPPPPAQA